MNETNTKGIGNVLNLKGLKYIPEAHTYLKINGSILDVTRNVISKNSFEDVLLAETEIEPNQIGSFKVKYHKEYMKQWLVDENIPYFLNAL